MEIVFTYCNSENSTCLIIRINLAIISYATDTFHIVTSRIETDICQDANIVDIGDTMSSMTAKFASWRISVFSGVSHSSDWEGSVEYEIIH